MLSHLPRLVLLCVVGVAEDKPAAYPHAELLMEPADLVKPQAAEIIRILDARGKSKYNDGHVPNAVWLDQTTWMRSFGDGQDKEAWAERIGALGIKLDTPVVIYDDGGFKDAGRMWWILRYWGVRDVRLLDGGWRAWEDGKLPISKEVPGTAAVDVKLEPQADRHATKTQMLESVKSRNVQIIDARSLDEYRGEANTAKRNGAIPTALHFEWSDAIDAKTRRFKTADELAKLLKERGIDPSRPCLTYCQSGGRAAVMAFTLELMGAKDVRNYYKSWAEWGNAEDTPIEKPKP